MDLDEISQVHLQFQTALLKYLEPIQIPRHSVIQGQKQSVDELVFLMDG